MKDKSKIKKILIIAILIFSGISCKDEINNVIPNKSFSISVSPAEVLSMGVGSTTVKSDGGIAGLIIYRISQDEFQAYDRLCTNYPADTATVVLNAKDGTATCPKCKTTFLIYSFAQPKSGSGPAKYSLKQYQTELRSDGRLYIWN